MRKWWPTMNSPATSSASCSSCARATTTVSGRRTEPPPNRTVLKCDPFLVSLLRFPELPEDSDGQHHHHQRHHLHRGLPAPTAGAWKLLWLEPKTSSRARKTAKALTQLCSYLISSLPRPPAGVHQWLLLVLLRERHHRWTRQEELLQSHDCGQAGVQQLDWVHPGSVHGQPAVSGPQQVVGRCCWFPARFRSHDDETRSGESDPTCCTLKLDFI